MLFIIVLLLYASFSPDHTVLDIPRALHARFVGLTQLLPNEPKITSVSDTIEIVYKVDKVPRPGDLALVPGYNQYLTTDRDGFNVNVYQNHTFVRAINVEIEGAELFAYESHFGMWDIVFDNNFNGTANKTIYMSLGTASPDLFGPDDDRIGIHTVVRAEYDPTTMQIVGLEGGELRKPRNLCENCYTTDETRVPMPIFDVRPQGVPELPASSIIFQSTRNPQFFNDPEHYRGQIQHRGSSIVFYEFSNGGKLLMLPDNTLLFSIGYVHQKQVSQDLTLFDGKIVRMTRDGQPVCDIANIEDNPFCDSDHPVTRYIYSYGHKNNQGLAIDAYGRIFASEHGEQGGDEINRIYAGQNYGFPHFAGGASYLGGSLGDRYPAPDSLSVTDTIFPLFVWNYTAKSIAPAGTTYYTHDNQYKDSLFVATLAAREVTRIHIDRNGNAVFAEPIITGCRFRDVEIDTEGLLYILTDDCGELIVAEIVDNQ